MGEIDLELGAVRLSLGDAAGAREPLERVVAARPGTVRGRWLLARALEATGDAAAARRVRDDAWREYLALPRFQRRRERPFAWRLRPWRPALYAVLAAVAAVAVARFVAPMVLPPRAAADAELGAEVDDWQPAASPPDRASGGAPPGSPPQ
jgi:hypothetical protein